MDVKIENYNVFRLKVTDFCLQTGATYEYYTKSFGPTASELKNISNQRVIATGIKFKKLDWIGHILKGQITTKQRQPLNGIVKENHQQNHRLCKRGDARSFTT